MTESDKSDYIIQTWLGFCKRRGSVRPTMSSNEFNLIVTLRDEGVPLRIVLRGIQDCGGTPKHLLYCEPAINEAYKRWRTAVQL